MELNTLSIPANDGLSDSKFIEISPILFGTSPRLINQVLAGTRLQKMEILFFDADSNRAYSYSRKQKFGPMQRKIQPINLRTSF